MDNQHRHIKGYRELSQGEIDLINDIKQAGLVLEDLVRRVDEHLAIQHVQAYSADNVDTEQEEARIEDAAPIDWLTDGKRSLQKGLMFLTRSVAQPTFF